MWCAGPRREGPSLRGHRQRRQGASASRAAAATVAVRRAELEVHALAVGPDGRALRGHLARRQGLRDRRGGQVARPSSIRPTSTSGRSPSTRRAASSWRRGRGAHPPRRQPDGQVPRSLLRERREAHHRPGRGRAGNVFAGSSPGGVLYRIDPAGKVFVLHDSAFREVKALDVGAGRQRLRRAHRRTRTARRAARADHAARASPPTTGQRRREVTVTESFTIAARARARRRLSRGADASRRSGSAKGARAARPALGRGRHAVVLVGRDAARARRGRRASSWAPATRARSTASRDDRTWTMVAASPRRAGDEPGAPRIGRGRSSPRRTPARVHVAGAARRPPAARSPPRSRTPRPSRSWGRRALGGRRLPAGTASQVQTRSGNTAHAGRTWSAWSAPYARAEGEPVAERAARFLQLRLVAHGKRRPHARARHGDRGLPAAQPAARRSSRSPCTRPARSSRSRSRERRRRDPGPRRPARERTARPPPGRRGPECRRPSPTAASCTRRASRPSRGRRTTPTATPCSYDVELPRARRRALPAPAQGADGGRAGLGHHDRPQRPLRHPRDGLRRAQQSRDALALTGDGRARPSTSTTRRPRSRRRSSPGSPARDPAWPCTTTRQPVKRPSTRSTAGRGRRSIPRRHQRRARGDLRRRAARPRTGRGPHIVGGARLGPARQRRHRPRRGP